MLARDIMRSDVLTLRPETTLREAAVFLVRHRISGAPVVGPGRRLIGLISSTDLMRNGQEAPEAEVGAVMTPAAYCAKEETPVAELARFMLAKRVHRVVIVRRGRLKGIVTSMDMLRALLKTSKGRRTSPRGAKK